MQASYPIRNHTLYARYFTDIVSMSKQFKRLKKNWALETCRTLKHTVLEQQMYDSCSKRVTIIHYEVSWWR